MDTTRIFDPHRGRKTLSENDKTCVCVCGLWAVANAMEALMPEVFSYSWLCRLWNANIAD